MFTWLKESFIRLWLCSLLCRFLKVSTSYYCNQKPWNFVNMQGPKVRLVSVNPAEGFSGGVPKRECWVIPSPVPLLQVSNSSNCSLPRQICSRVASHFVDSLGKFHKCFAPKCMHVYVTPNCPEGDTAVGPDQEPPDRKSVNSGKPWTVDDDSGFVTTVSCDVIIYLKILSMDSGNLPIV